ncbi:MAG: radical SAM protein, partial [Candidatus Aminicenantales bacterium]
PTPVVTLVKAKEIAVGEGMKYVYIGNVPGIGGEDTYCPSCRTLLVKRMGFSIKENHLSGGQCPKCGTAIPGRWA